MSMQLMDDYYNSINSNFNISKNDFDIIDGSHEFMTYISGLEDLVIDDIEYEGSSDFDNLDLFIIDGKEDNCVIYDD